MDPILDTYSPLLINLEKMGHLRFDPHQPEKPSTLFPLPYDWRRSNDRSADRLADRIPQALDLARPLDYVGEPEGGPAAKVDLVVHSMGGLVTRAYAQRYPGSLPGQYHGDIRRVVFIATPHRGFPATYRIWEGLTWDNFLPSLQHILPRTLMDGVIWPKYVFKKFLPTRLEMMSEGCGLDPLLPPQVDCPFRAFALWSHGGRNDDSERGIESLPQMLPDDAWPDYLFCAGEAGQACAAGEVNPYGRPGNAWLTSLNADVDRLASNLGPANIAVVYGTGTATDLTYRVGGPDAPFWRNGRVVSGALDPSNPPVGDDLIPANSMNLSLLLPDIPVGNVFERTGQSARHKEILFHPDVQTAIVPGFLTGQTLPFSEPYVIDIPSQGVPLMFDVDCPVNLTVTDPGGRRVGFDPATGGFVNEIPGAIYAAPGTRGQFVLVPDSPAGNWRMRLEAFEDGDYGATAWRLEPGRPRALARFAGSFAAGAVAEHGVRVEDDTVFADGFDRPNSTDLGPAWEERTGNWRIRSGALHVGRVNPCISEHPDPTAPGPDAEAAPGGATGRGVIGESVPISALRKEVLSAASLVAASFTLETRLRLAGSPCGGDRDQERDEDEQGPSRAEVSFGRASDGTGGYRVVIEPRRRLRLVRADGILLGTARVSGGERNVWQRIKVAREGDGLIAVYLDEGGGYPADPQIRAHDQTHLDLGRLGFGLSGEGSGLDVDWITVSGR
jgi:pimeloyl-ACP methyl ester carboxylesterase